MNNEGEGIGSIIVLGLLIWGGVSLWGWIFPSEPDIQPNSYTPSYTSPRYSNDAEDCTEPENPYDDGSGHYAGFEWGENGNYCDGNSNSFIEGCEEYEAQEETYEACLSN